MNITGSGPIMGPYLADFLRAGAEFGGTTLPRFYAVHMLLVPGLIIALIGAHLYLVVKLGTTAPPWMRAQAKPKSLREHTVGPPADVGGNGGSTSSSEEGDSG
jgi:quinol-cytochrome oxidoreductase complex cytochrome b subunit